MTPHQNKVIAALKEAKGWMTITDLVNKTGISNSVMHRILENKKFNNIEKSFRTHHVKGRTLDVKIFRLNRPNSNVSEAYELAKQYQGLFGQLFWATNGTA